MAESLVNKRILGIDYGKRFVGVAISDPLNVTALPHSVIERPRPNKQRRLIAALKEICDDNSISCVVVGLPKNLDGSENERCEYTYEFCKLLHKRIDLPIYLWDERLTTIEADNALMEMNVKDVKAHSDEVAATLILQDFLAAIKNNGVKEPYLG